jgi:hypothetical protein
MKRLLLCAAVALAVSLVLAPAALASVGAHHSDVNVRPLGLAAHARTTAPVGDTGLYNISGHVLDYAGDPVLGAEVDWGFWTDASGYTFGGTNYPGDTGADGAFAFTGVSGGHVYNSLPGDDLDVYYNPTADYALEAIVQWSLDFSANNDATPYSYDVQPGEANLNLADYPFTWAEVRAGNENEGYARADVDLTNYTTGTASVLPSSNVNDVSAYMYYSGYTNASYVTCPFNIEWLATTGMSVTAGTTAASTVPLDGDNAQWAYLAGYQCRHSGAAGRTVTMELQDWPVNEVAGFEGWYGAELTSPYPYETTKTSTSATATYLVPLKIDPHAPVGVYEIDAYNTTSLADMWDLYQVTTCKASASSIRLGHAVRLSGKVPGSGTATLYSITKKVSAQPSTLSAKGWHKVASVAIKSGKFTTASLHPKRTTWYVIKYKGSAFWAFTQVVKVTVH